MGTSTSYYEQTNVQVCWNNGSRVFTWCMALCLAYDSGIQYSLFSFQTNASPFVSSYHEKLLLAFAEWPGPWLGPGFCSQTLCRGSNQFFFFSFYLSSLLFVIVIRSSTVFFAWTQPAHEKIGVVDSQWIVHQGVPSLGNQVNPSF